MQEKKKIPNVSKASNLKAKPNIIPGWEPKRFGF